MLLIQEHRNADCSLKSAWHKALKRSLGSKWRHCDVICRNARRERFPTEHALYARRGSVPNLNDSRPRRDHLHCARLRRAILPARPRNLRSYCSVNRGQRSKFAGAQGKIVALRLRKKNAILFESGPVCFHSSPSFSFENKENVFCFFSYFCSI